MQTNSKIRCVLALKDSLKLDVTDQNYMFMLFMSVLCGNAFHNKADDPCYVLIP